MAAAPLYEVRHERPRDEELARQIDRHGLGELGRGGLLDRLDEEDPGVVHHDVGDAGFLEDLAHRARDVRGHRDVATDVGLAVRRAVGEGTREADHVGAGGAHGVGHRQPDAAGGAGDKRDLSLERSAQGSPLPPWTSRRNSSRVLASSRKAPRSALVTVLEFCFSTPRIIMQRW